MPSARGRLAMTLFPTTPARQESEFLHILRGFVLEASTGALGKTGRPSHQSMNTVARAPHNFAYDGHR